jgi:hypothetical protein
MKHRIVAFVCSIAAAFTASAQVPSLINYQGRLTDSEGAPVTGSKNFVISIYDAATDGTLLYTETIGAVTLDDNGVYSFQFGGTGTSNTLVTETVATTNGTSTTFQKVLDNSPIVANSVSVSDGTYTWSQSAGSSNEDQFGGAYSTSLRHVTANYYNGAPAAGRTITATYRYGTSGITGALSNGAEHWMAVSVDGATQGSRQRVLAVPFAQRASFSAVAEQLADQIRFWRPSVFSAREGTQDKLCLTLPITNKIFFSNPSFKSLSTTAKTTIPANFKSIKNIDFEIDLPASYGVYNITVTITINEWNYSLVTTPYNSQTIKSSIPLDIVLNPSKINYLELDINTFPDSHSLKATIQDVMLTVTE